MLTFDAPLSDATRALFGDKTRGKILIAALHAFNTDGFDGVTTARLAEAAKVLDGTLWYHFKSKNDLVLAHLEALETRLDTHLGLDFATTPDGIVSDFFQTFSILWEFRYLLRDPLSGFAGDAKLQTRLKQAYQLVEQRTEARIRTAIDLGFLDLANSDAKTLAVSFILIGRYWPDYARIRYEDQAEPYALAQQGIQQMVSVIRPYFTQKAVELIQRSQATFRSDMPGSK